MLSAFIGSILNGLFSGFWVAFFTGWISWLSVIRILATGLYEMYLTVKAGTNFHAVDAQQYHSIGMRIYGGVMGNAPIATDDEDARIAQAINAAQHNLDTSYQHGPAVQNRLKKLHRSVFKELERTVTVFGWLGWTWSAVYTPISQSIWLAAHISSESGSALLFVRAVAIGVSALNLTFDYKHRYGAALGKKWGSWAFVAFNVWHSTACLLLGCEVLALLIRGAMNWSDAPIPLVVMYAIFSFVWAFGSWAFLPPVDGARPGINIFVDVAMGAFAGVFVAAPAFALWKNAQFEARTGFSKHGQGHGFGNGQSYESGLSLGDYLNCQGASVMEKFAAVMP